MSVPPDSLHEEKWRVSWRAYASAALTGLVGRPEWEDELVPSEQAAKIADEMIEEERNRFDRYGA